MLMYTDNIFQTGSNTSITYGDKYTFITKLFTHRLNKLKLNFETHNEFLNFNFEI